MVRALRGGERAKNGRRLSAGGVQLAAGWSMGSRGERSLPGAVQDAQPWSRSNRDEVGLSGEPWGFWGSLEVPLSGGAAAKRCE